MENTVIAPISTKNAHETIISIAKIYPRKTRIFVYPNLTKRLYDNLEPHDKSKSLTHSHDLDTPDPYYFGNVQRSIRRTRTIISDLVQCNDFELFVTFTFAQDRQDIEKSKQKMQNWLHSQQKQINKINKSTSQSLPQLKYLIVPEFHKDGKSIHFHALISGLPLDKLTKANIRQRGREVYNISAYHKGFTTAVFIDNHEKVANYIRKYITKDMPQFHGRKRYWRSLNLDIPKVVRNHLPDPSYREVYKNHLYSIYESATIPPTDLPSVVL